MKIARRDTSRLAAGVLALIISALLLLGPVVVVPAQADVTIPYATYFVFPVGDPLVSPAWGNNGYVITQGFNTSCDPSLSQGHYYYGYYFCGHTGVDLGDSSYGGVVRTTANGIVTFAGADGSFGNMVRVKHILPSGLIVYSQYEHLGYGTLTVWTGEVIYVGQQIGNVGDTGFTFGAHLHFEIKGDDTDGPGYTFGNAALIANFYDPLWFVGAHLPQQAAPTATATPVATPVIATLPKPTVVPVATTTAARQAAAASEGEQIIARFSRQYRDFVTVNTKALRLRTGPGLHRQQVGVVMKGTKLAYLGQSGVWMHVALPQNVQGWVHSQYVLKPAHWSFQVMTQPRVQRTTHVARTQRHPLDIHRLGHLAQVHADALNVHAQPSTSSPIVIQAYRGAEVAVRAVAGSWVRVTLTNDTTGWVLHDYLLMPHLASHIYAASRSSGSAHSVRVHLFHVRALTSPTTVRRKTSLSTVTTSTLHHLSARPTGPIMYVWATTLYVRQRPRLAAPVLDMIGENTVLVILGRHISWVHVRLPSGQTGWVLNHYVKPHRKIYLTMP